MMQSINNNGCSVHFNEHCYIALNNLLKEQSYSKIFCLVDVNSSQYCLPIFLEKLSTNLTIEVIEIEAGEIHKTIETCTQVWSALSDLGADRKSLLINIGGGVVTDLGGFVASTFKRGIAYVNVPTTLLSMVDASVGGKTGVDLEGLKNQIGVVSFGEMILIDSIFLNTLPANQLKSGYAEILKHGIIDDYDYWKVVSNLKDVKFDAIDEIIHQSVLIKNRVVTEDPNENNLRKILNFGHTLGHAIETFYLKEESLKDLLHGEAIAIGMIMESFISTKLNLLDLDSLNDISKSLCSIYGKIDIPTAYEDNITELLKFDKKNSHGKINFVLLEGIGKPKIDCQVENDIIKASFDYYRSLVP